MDNIHGNFEYTPEEIKSIENAMKNKEFRELLVQYVEEISDPKNKEEYDQYLKQLEGQQELPKGMSLIHPTACFCLKTKIKNKKNPDWNQKLFINICQAPDIEKPAQEKGIKSNKENAKGTQWHIPYSVGKIRMDQDKDKSVCQTVDIAFNPLTFEHCRKAEAFKNMICEISVEAASKQIRDPDEIISKDYKILNKMKCKGGKPAAMPVRLNAKPGEHDQKQDTTQQRNPDQMPKLYQDFVQQQKEYKDQQIKETIKKAETASRVVELASHDFEPIQEKPQAVEEDEKVSRIMAPKYNIVHSYGVEYSDFLMSGPEEGKKRRPKQLVIKIEVPRVQKMKDLDLDINDKHLILKAANKYYLDIALPYKVNPDDGSAKFDSKSKVLTITLPTVLEAEPEEPKTSNGITETSETPETREEDENNENENSALKFVNQETTQKYKEDQEKIIQSIAEPDRNLVEEIATNNNKGPQKEINRKFDFLTQETYENYFLIFNVINYEKDNVRVAFLENEVLFSYQDNERELSSTVRLSKSFNRKESQCNLVKDYIVINLKKSENEFWENKVCTKEEHNEEFESKIEAYQKQKQQEEEEAKAAAALAEANKEVPQKEEEVEEEDNEENTETSKAPTAEDDKKKIEERFVEKRSINFINFNRDNFVFELD